MELSAVVIFIVGVLVLAGLGTILYKFIKHDQDND